MKVYKTDRSLEESAAERIKVGIADYAIAQSGSTLVTSGLGSCVGIALVDTDAGVAGLAHAMLPSDGDDRASDGDDRASDGDDRAGDDASVVDGAVDTASQDDTEAKYVDTAVPGLLRSMTEAGADSARLEARIAGGSAMFEFTAEKGGVGERNVAAAEAELAARRIPIVGRDVGGDYGRSLRLDTATGELTIRRAHGETHII
jgi:chemotaxis protein CheD